MTSKISSWASSQVKASLLTSLSLFDAYASALSLRSSGSRANSWLMCGSSSTRVTCSTLGHLQHLAQRQAVAAAQDGHALGRAVRGHHRVHQRLVITVLVARIELQVAVEEQARAALAVGRDDHALVVAAGGVDDALAVEAVFGPGGQAVGAECGSHQRSHHQPTGQGVRPHATDLGAKQPQCPRGDGSIHQAEHDARAHQAELRQQEQREGDGHRERAEVVEGQHLRYQFRQLPAAAEMRLQDAHHERDLEPDQRADEQHHRIQQHAEGCGGGGIVQQVVGDEQRGGHQAADQPHQQFDAQEGGDKLPLDVAAQVGADAEREQVDADDGAELQHRIAEQPTRQRARRQLVEQAAGGDDEDRGQQGHLGRRDARRQRVPKRPPRLRLCRSASGAPLRGSGEAASGVGHCTGAAKPLRGWVTF